MANLNGYQPTRLPARPLLDFIDKLGGWTLVADRAQLGVKERAQMRNLLALGRRRGTVTMATADRICIDVLDLNPADIYGDAWWDVDE